MSSFSFAAPYSVKLRKLAPNQEEKPEEALKDPFVVYNYMDTLPSFANLSKPENKQLTSSKNKRRRENNNDKAGLDRPGPASKKAKWLEENENEKSRKQDDKAEIIATPTDGKNKNNIPVTDREEDSIQVLPAPPLDNLSTDSAKDIDNNKEQIEDDQKEIKKPVKANVILETESDGKWLYCPVKSCPFWTRKQIRMERHEKSHIPGDDRFYQCPECDLKICSLPKLLRHDRKFHTGFKDYECKICEAEVTDIAVHMRVHRTEKQFTCHVCKLQFRHKNSLVRHLFQHSGERPFRCQNCESGFTSINRLKEHIKKKHPDTPAAKSIMEPITLTPTTGATPIKPAPLVSNTSKYAPIAPKTGAAIRPGGGAFHPQTIVLPNPSTLPQTNLPILAPGPNGTMILLQNPAPAFNATPLMLPAITPQFISPSPLVVATPSPLIYSLPTAVMQPQTIVAPSTIVKSEPKTPAAPASVEEITVLNENGESQKFDILERAILEIPGLQQQNK